MIHKTHTYTKMNLSSEMGPVTQNTIKKNCCQSIKTVGSVHVYAVHCAQMLHTVLHSSDPIMLGHSAKWSKEAMGHFDIVLLLTINILHSISQILQK